MRHLSITPSIMVTIGPHTRLYFAFVTTAPADLDSPATLTLHASTWADVVGLAADPIASDEHLGRTPARLVLVDAMEHASAAISICCSPRIPGSSASPRCSTGYGSACAPHSPVRWPHDARPLFTRVNRSPFPASFSGGHVMSLTVKITPNDKGNPPGKLADAELHFTDGELDGLKLIGFSIWERRGGGGRNVTFPARQYAVNGERRSFALLRPIADVSAQNRVRELVGFEPATLRLTG